MHAWVYIYMLERVRGSGREKGRGSGGTEVGVGVIHNSSKRKLFDCDVQIEINAADKG